IEAFTVYAETPLAGGGSWEKVYMGTTVGYKKICRFAPVETTALKITIERSRVFPTLRFIGVY
ncbi:MAG: hypothetical protein LBD08_06210, partial [Treponema sp.]|nr:hypothetical protein [Treponema sp.]